MRAVDMRGWDLKRADEFAGGCRCDECRAWFSRRAKAVLSLDEAVVYLPGKGLRTVRMPPVERGLLQ